MSCNSYLVQAFRLLRSDNAMKRSIDVQW
jgi:hypothetical protein